MSFNIPMDPVIDPERRKARIRFREQTYTKTSAGIRECPFCGEWTSSHDWCMKCDRALPATR